MRTTPTRPILSEKGQPVHDLTAVKAIMASFFIPVSFLGVLREAPALLERQGVDSATSSERIRGALDEMLRRRAIECMPDGTLILHRERYPVALRSEVCREFDELDFDDVGEGFYKPLDEIPFPLRALFEDLIDSGEMNAAILDGDTVLIPDGVYLPFLDEHARLPFLPLRLFDDHPLADAVMDGTVVPVVRWNTPMVSYGDYRPYSYSGDDPQNWIDLEVRTSLGLS